MMSFRSTSNTQQQVNRDTKNKNKPSIPLYLHNQSGLNFTSILTLPTRDEESPPPAPPVRDSSSLKSVKYGPGHEKFPSWPVPAAAETPQALRAPPTGGSHRSKSWADHTNYPKEKVMTYTRPYMRRQNSSHIQQKLKTVMEKCEKIPPETYESRLDKISDRLYLPHVDHDGKILGDIEYNVPSPPEREVNKPQLTQEELEEYTRSYQDPSIEKYQHYSQDMKGLKDFIEYARTYEECHINQKHETILAHLHQKQLSYAQSEGYHSYVSSTDSTSTPFLDRLRRDSEAIPIRQSVSWDDSSKQETNARGEGRDSVVTTSSGSASSSETLKWHGSISDVSVASNSHLGNPSSSSAQRQQHIAHSARVQTPQRHHSESVLYISTDTQENWNDSNNRNSNTNKLKLFAINTYTVQDDEPKDPQPQTPVHSVQLPANRMPQLTLSVADRISELEKQQKYSYLDPDKKHKVPDPTLKAIQKKALLSFYERHHNSNSNNFEANRNSTWRSEPQLTQLQPLPPQPPPRTKAQTSSRRASCASDYASNNSKRSSLASSHENRESAKIFPKHQHSSSCGSLSTDLLGPVIVGPSISLDDWIPEKPPERPPKHPHLRIAYPDLFQNQRVPSPDLPPPSPPTLLEDEVINCDEPLPPPPTELQNSEWQNECDDSLTNNTTSHQFSAPLTTASLEILEEPNKCPKLCTESHRKSVLGAAEQGSTIHSSMRHAASNYKLMQSENRHISSDSKHGHSENRTGSNNNRNVLSESKLIEEKYRHLFDDVLNQSNVYPQYGKRERSIDTCLANDNQSFNSNADDLHQSATKEQVFSVLYQRNFPERSSKRYSSNHKLILNDNIDPSKKIGNGICDQYRTDHLWPSTFRDDDKLQAVSLLRSNQRASIAEGSPRDIPPPLQPRQMRINQSMRARIPENRQNGIIIRTSPAKNNKLRDSRQPSYSVRNQSKDLCLASRHDRNKVVPDSDMDSHKRTSPNNHFISTEAAPQQPPKLNPKNAIWAIKSSNNNIIRRACTFSKSKNPTNQCLDMKEDIKKHQVILPDVLPVNAKLAPRSQYPNQTANLTLPSRLDSFSPQTNFQSTPASPPKSPSKISPYVLFSSANVHNSPKDESSMRLIPQVSFPNSIQYANPPTTISTPMRIFPPAKPISPMSPSLVISGGEPKPTTLLLQRNPAENNASISSPEKTTMQFSNSPASSPERDFPLPLQDSPPPIKTLSCALSQLEQSFEIQPRLSPHSSNENTPIRCLSPSSSPSNTPLCTTPEEASPPSSPKVIHAVHTISPPQSPKVLKHYEVMEGLQMIQRTEVILRVNATTTDASSQTDREELPPTPLPTRRKLQEEIDCEKLSEDFIRQLPAADRLKELLVPGPEHKKLTDYVTGLFQVDVTLKPRPINSPFRSRNNTLSSSPPPINSTSSITYITAKLSDLTSLVPTSPLPASSPYFTTSEPKAKFLTRYSQDMKQYTIKNTKDLNQKKDELVNRLDQKLEVLRSEQLVVSEEYRINNELGQNVESHLAHVARPHEASKFRLHIEEIGKITSLLLSLSGRLARVENALMGMAEEHPERSILESRRDKLLDQLDEAKKLKESIDRRSVSVSNILYKYLTSEEYADYNHFINMKAKLIMDSKEIADKIKLGEEQLMALKETLIVVDC